MAKKGKTIPPQLTYGFLGVLSVVTLLLGFSSLGHTIKSPAEKAAYERQQIFERAQSVNIVAEQQLRVQDTDLDGLTDFNELNLYGTSPYLADTDSDGFNDKHEIESGNDPNCPAGIDCHSVPVSEEDLVIDEEGVLVDDFGNLLATPPIEEGAVIDLENLSVPEIRELMLQSGEITKAQLDEIDDETIMQIYKEVIREAGGSL